MGYGAILVDPPWHYTMRSAKGEAKSPQAQYATMTDAEILALPVSHLAERDCFLIMWAVWPKLPLAIECVKRWGFDYKTGGSWHKLTMNGKTSFGTGYIFRSACEPYVLGTLGSPEIGSKSVRNLIAAPTRGHSRKPDDMRRNVEKLAPNVRRCELFAREPWPGNDVWGNETEKFT
jgi:N6-adenosine-specific RNA methylase IME4